MIMQPNGYVFKYVKVKRLRKIALYSLPQTNIFPL